MAALDQRIALRYHIPAPALTAGEAAGYIRAHLELAGRSDTLFSDDAVRVIHGHARGLPRAINRLAITALLAAYTTGKTIADESIRPHRHQRGSSPARLTTTPPPCPPEPRPAHRRAGFSAPPASPSPTSPSWTS